MLRRLRSSRAGLAPTRAPQSYNIEPCCRLYFSAPIVFIVAQTGIFSIYERRETTDARAEEAPTAPLLLSFVCRLNQANRVSSNGPGLGYWHRVECCFARFAGLLGLSERHVPMIFTRHALTGFQGIRSSRRLLICPQITSIYGPD